MAKEIEQKKKNPYLNPRFILRSLRRRAVYGIIGPIFRNKPVPLPIDPKSVEKILIIRYDFVGDMIVSTPTFEMIKQIAPHAQLDVMAAPNNSFIIEGNPYIDNIHKVPHGVKSRIRAARKLKAENYDLILPHIFLKTTNIGIITNIIGGPKARKVYMDHPTRSKLYSYLFNSLIERPMGPEYNMIEVLKKLTRETFGVGKEIDAEPRLEMPEASKDKAEDFYSALPQGKTIVINMSARQKNNSWKEENKISFVRQVAGFVGSKANLVLISAPGDTESSKLLEKELSPIVIYFEPTKVYADTAAIVAKADLLITPDTSILHLPSIFKVPVYALYSRYDTQNPLWSPSTEHYDYSLADVDEDLNTLPPERAAEELKEFIEKISLFKD